MTRGDGGYPTVFLHIGTPKSGTTYLQSRLDANRELAKAQGLMWPAPNWGVQVEAVRDLRQVEPGVKLDPAGPWMRLVESAMTSPGTRALISMEWMAGCTSDQVAAAMSSLEPARVEIICTTRDLLRMFVAQWQEMTKNCRPWTWRQFVDEMHSEVYDERKAPAAFRFWTQQNVPVILRRWAQHVPWEQIHLVTVPPSGSDPEVLWNRFCSVVGIDGSAFAQPAWANESIGVVSASLMHRVNLVARDKGISMVEYQRVLHRRLADDVLARFRGREASIAVTPETDAWIRERSERLLAEIGELRLHVVGDLADLAPGRPLEGRLPDDVSDTELLDTCVEALVDFAIAEQARAKRLREQNRALRERLAGRGAGRQPRAPGAVTAHQRTTTSGSGSGSGGSPLSTTARLRRKAKRIAARGRAGLARLARR